MSRTTTDADAFSNQPLVFDSGSGLIKAGFAGAEMPQLIFPAYVGRPKHVKIMAGAVEGQVFCGDRARDLRGLLKLNYPTVHGHTVDWEDQHTLYSHAYSELNITPDAHPLLLTVPPLATQQHQLKATELFFESFAVPALYLQIQSILALYASGRTTGVVVDCGDGQSSVVPVYEGFLLPHAVNRMDLGGRDITHYLQLLLRKSGVIHFQTTSEMEVCRDVKEKVCYVAYHLAQSEKTAAALSRDVESEPEVPFKLPDGQVIQIGAEKYRAPELLFQPSLIGSESLGLHQLLHQSIARCDLDIRRQLYSHIILCGGTTMFDGFGDRLLSELRRQSPRDTKIKIWAPPERILSVWMGGSILASLSTFRHVWTSKKEYEEQGKSIVFRKGF